jgi:uncharacterized protein (TIGR00266 family)
MDFNVKGTVLPALEVTLQEGETVITTHGDLGWMSPNVAMAQSTTGKGLMSGLKRMVGGAGLFLTRYTAQQGSGVVVFPAKLPGNIIRVDVTPQLPYYVHRSGFLCGTEGVQAEVAFQQSLAGGFFGGMGFFLQHLSGEGVAWLELSGELFTYTLAPGQTILVHPSLVGAFQEGVSFQITTIPGIANKFFGRNGLFLAQLTGPGEVWLQTMDMTELAAEIERYMPKDSSGSKSSGISINL